LDSGHVDEGAERIELELKLADLLREELYEVDEALDYYRDVLATDPENARAVEALEQLVEDEGWAAEVTDDLADYYADKRDFESLVSLYELRKEQSYEPDEKIGFLEQIGRVYRDQLDRPMAAIEAFSEAWTLDPTRDDLHEALLELAYAEEAFDHLVQVYEDGITSVSDPEAMLEFRLRLAQLYVEKLDDPFEAETHYREVLNLESDNEVAFAALENLLVEGERWVDLAELLERRVDVASSRDEQEAIDLLLELAELQRDQLDDAFTAADVYRRVLEFDPAESTANEALRNLYREQERWDDLGELLRRQVELASEPDEIISLQRELADLKRTRLMEPREALELYRAILEVEPDDEASIEALEAMFESSAELSGEIAAALEPIYRAQSEHARLVEVLVERAESARSEEMARDFYAEAAQIAEQELEDLELAVEMLRRVFSMDPSSRRTRLELHRVCARSNHWRELVEAYDDVLQSNFEVDDELRADLLAEQGAIYEGRLCESAAAREAYSEVLLYEPTNEEAIDGLERMLAREENWLDLAQFYRERSETAEEDEQRRRWLEHLATLYEEVLDDLDEAIAVYNQLLDLAPTDPDVQRTLVRLYGHAERWHDLADLYRRRIEQNIDPDRVVDLRFELASLLEAELDRIDEAVEIYKEILEEAPDHPETIRAMEGLRRDLANREGEWSAQRREIIELLVEKYNERKHWRRIVELLDEKQQMMSDVDRQVDLLSEMADLIQRSADEQADKMQALMKLARAFCIDPDNDQLRERVAERADQLDAWEGVLQVFLRGLENTDDPTEQAQILRAVAEAYAGPMDDAESAITAYQQVLELDGDTDTLTRLQHLYSELELWEPLVEILERRLENEYDGEARSGLLRRIAMVYDDILDEPVEAIAYYEELRELDPNDATVLGALARLYEDDERWIDLEEVLLERIEVVDEVDERIEALRTLAVVQRDRLDEPNEAIATYERLLELDPEDGQAVRSLSRLLEATERWVDLLDNLALERDFAGGLDELNDIEMRMARVRLERLDEPEEALSNVQNVLDRDPEHDGARQMLLERVGDSRVGQRAAEILQGVYRAAGEFDELEKLFEQRLESAAEPERRAEIYMELAQLYEEHHESSQMAFMTLGRGLRDVPGVAFLRRELERLAERLDNVDELAAVYEDAIEVAELDPDQEVTLRKELGELYVEQLEDIEAALEHFEAAWRLDEFDVELLDWLDQLYQRANRWEDLAMVLQNRLSVAEPDEINDVRFRLGYLHEVIFEDHHEALDLYREVILSEPEHGGVLEGLGRMLDDLEVRREVCELLEPVYEDLGADEALAELLEEKLEVADGASERAELHRRIARLQMESLGSIYGGYAHLGRAFREDPHDAQVQERLEELAEEHELYDQLVGLYEEVVDELSGRLEVAEPVQEEFWTAAVGPDETVDLLLERLSVADERVAMIVAEPATGFDFGEV
ncbi:MAG: DUF7436 family protein, partial [Persicimonas sp.]